MLKIRSCSNQGETILKTGNLFQSIPCADHEEIIDALVDHAGVTIERITSKGQSSSKDFWFDEARSEWVLLLQGQARLRFEQGNEILDMAQGDWVDIPAHCRHRVEWTAPEEETLWLTVYRPAGRSPSS